jgi:two-component system NtrC family response regulator
MPERTVLVVDDEAAQRLLVAGFLRKRGFGVLEAATADEAHRLAAEKVVDLVLTDLRLPGESGLALLDRLRAVNPEVPVVVITAFGSVATAVDAMKRGAADYLTKPVDLDELEVLVERTLERRALVSENRELRRQVEARHRLAGLETSNRAMAEALSLAARAAGSRATVLLRGESGTGKELLARAIHHASPRASGPWVAVNLAALPDTLLESELFGHERGAFTGADRERRGRFELADGGTLFLDEVGDLPPATQVKLLRALQEQTFERLGGTRTLRADVRVVAATHRDLPALVHAGGFRADLYYRLAVVTITLPPLRDRREDIPHLVDTFLRRFSTEAGGAPRTLSREAMDRLMKYGYPGNVRELENLLQRAVVLARDAVIRTTDLPLHLGELRSEGIALPERLVARLAAFERGEIQRALAEAGGVQTRAARALGISERHLRYRLRKHGLEGNGRNAE